MPPDPPTGYCLTIPYYSKPKVCHPLGQCLNETLHSVWGKKSLFSFMVRAGVSSPRRTYGKISRCVLVSTVNVFAYIYFYVRVLRNIILSGHRQLDHVVGSCLVEASRGDSTFQWIYTLPSKAHSRLSCV